MENKRTSDADYEAYEIRRIELARKRNIFRCADGYCGADDCDRCRPGWWQNYGMEDENAEM
jgi:hypothetical protein